MFSSPQQNLTFRGPMSATQTPRYAIKPWHKKAMALMGFGAMLTAYVLMLPSPLFEVGFSTVVFDRQGEMLSARVARDGQWRFPPGPDVPEKFAQCLIEFEDRWFYSHPGFNPVSFGRAAWHNLTSEGKKQGGSTLTMQVARLSRGDQPRNVLSKLYETMLASRIEVRHTKAEILALYAAHAPFGGNVVGLEAASWRYFGRAPHNLSWAESAMLAVLPNAPALIHPGRNRSALKAKRDRLLKRLLQRGIIGAEECSLAMMEPLPDKPLPLPDFAPHLLLRSSKQGLDGQRITSTLNANLQQRMAAFVARHHRHLVRNEVHNAALLLLDTRTGQVLAYVGNVRPEMPGHGEEVDIIASPRSSGSLLKPFIYAALMQDGKIMPRALVPDIPTDFSGYSPKNFFPVFDGAVPADEALVRSLNIPAVFMLRELGIERFHGLLKQCGLSTLRHGPAHYGLALALGGAEVTLWDVTTAYARLGKTLMNDTIPFRPMFLLNDTTTQPLNTPFDAAAAYLTLEAITALNRPNSEGDYQVFSSTKRVAWKTGTSFGLRDAWAVGTTPDYTIGVWCGNASGEGRPGIMGLSAAAPLLFDALNNLPGGGWFQRPTAALGRITACAKSGMRPGPHCTIMDTILAHPAAARTTQCTMHKLVFVNQQGLRASADCASPTDLIPTPWFELRPLQAWYYKKRHADYVPMPNWAPGCAPAVKPQVMEWVYPQTATTVVIPREMDGTRGKAVFELAHTDPSSIVYWHLDGDFLGQTSTPHKMDLAPIAGPHTITVIDDDGNNIKLNFKVLR